MTDEQNKRPNLNYNLSKPENNVSSDENLTFYYSRERRLKNAPKEVQDIYSGKTQSRVGIFSVLVADKPRRVLFFVIVFLCAAILILVRMGFFDTAHILDGNKIEIAGTVYEGTTIVILRKNAKNEDAYTGAVDIAVSPVVKEDETYNVFYHRIFFTLEAEEVYRFAVPFDTPELLMVLQNEMSELQLKFNPE